MLTKRKVNEPMMPARNGFVFLALIAICIFAKPCRGISTNSTTLAISPSSSVVAGTVVTMTASPLHNGLPVTSGSITFCNAAAACPGPGVLGVVQVTTSGIATLKFVPGVGSYNLRASFNGPNGNWNSASDTQGLTVTGNSSYQSATSIMNSGNAGSYTLTATVTAFGRVVPAGSVSFEDTSNGNYVIGTASIDPSTANFSFSQATSMNTVGVGPYYAVPGDFNGDGIPDLALVDGSGLDIFLGKGDGTFQTPTMIATGLLPQSVAVGDFNADGIQDLAIANYQSGTISIVLGNGDVTFQSQVTYASGNGSKSVEVADVNWDGVQDLVVANVNDSNVSVFLGNGDGTFQAAATYPTGNGPNKVAIGDFNGDGFPDIATANANDNDVTILLNNGDGTFAAPQAYLTGAGARSVETGDLNGDGYLDLVVGNYNGNTISVLLGNGDGTFQTQVSYSTGTSPLQMALADFNGDSQFDVAIANANDNTVSVLLGKGDGTFQAQVVYPVGSSPLAVVAADFNGDGIPDIATPNFVDGGAGTVSILLGQESVTASANNVNAPGGGTHNIVASYPRDASHAASQSTAIPLVGGPAIATATSLTSSVNPAQLGQMVKFTGTVSPTPSGATNGTMSFYSGATLLGGATVNGSGVATFETSTLSSGVDSITAVYSGNTIFAASTSSPLIETVTKPGLTATTTSLGATPNQTTSGEQVTLTAMVSPVPTGSPLGMVNFYDGTTPIGAITVDASGVATFNTSSLPVGTDSITAVYSGNAGFAGSTSTATIETVTRPGLTATAITLGASPSVVTSGQRVVLNATVNPAPTGSPIGTVNFYNGTTLLSAASINAGVATFTTSSLRTGTDSITAVYSGNASFAGSTSAVASVTVTSDATFTISTPQAPLTLNSGGSVNVTVTVAPEGGAFNDAVSLSSSGLPANLTTSWSAATVTPGSKSVTSVLTIQAAAQSSQVPQNRRPGIPLSTTGLAFGVCLLAGGKRKWLAQSLQVLVICAALTTAMTLTGCAGGLGVSSTQTQSQNYTVTIKGTSGSLHSSTTFNLTVQ